MSKERGKPMRVAEALAAYLKRSGIGDRLEQNAVVDDWAERVGPRIAAVATPVHVAQGVLLVAVESSGWLMELRLMETDIRRRLNEGREKGRVERIRFVLTGGDEPTRPAGWRSDRHR
jgi:predicted nucleic acid-binding Zn ribbon protein